MIGSEEKAPERGAASLFIELRDGRIIVTHGTDKVELLNREAFTGDWDLLWKILRGENQVAPAEQSEPITAQDEFFKEQAERAVRSILQDHSLPVLWLSPEDFQQQDMDDENSRREDAGEEELKEPRLPLDKAIQMVIDNYDQFDSDPLMDEYWYIVKDAEYPDLDS